jgi:LmbE family N-acetylglucosaminyl deacetylase
MLAGFAPMLFAAIMPTLAPTPPAGEVLRAIRRLQVVGSVLYVAAHPDDENTRLIAWLQGQKGLRTAYVSLTRGAGGQNLIGDQQGDLLGVIRTGELLAARQLDGALQFFTRARDFGYSKTPDETLRIWSREDVLEDVVRTVRTFRPDVIITRFEAGGGPNHGHHTASAILAAEAFKAAADPQRFPGTGEPWQADRLIHNQSNWRITPETDTSGWLKLDVGSFDPLIGQSYGEVAARSRSQHKSQGFGAAPQFGSQIEYFTPLAGPPLTPADDIFKGLVTGWNRFPGQAALVSVLAEAEAAFSPTAPHLALPALARAHALLEAVPDAHWRAVKRAELEAVMLACAGVRLSARFERPSVVPGEAVKVALSALSRAPVAVSVDEVKLSVGGSTRGGALTENIPWINELAVTVPADAPLAVPHWLAQPGSPGLDGTLGAGRIEPEASPMAATFALTVAGRALSAQVPIEHAWTDAVAGERSHAVEVLPPVTATFEADSLLLPRGKAGTVRLVLRASTPAGATGTLHLVAATGYTIRPKSLEFSLTEADPERVVEVAVEATPQAAPGPLTAEVETGGRRWSWQRAVIDAPHLPRRTVLRAAELPLVPVDLARGRTQRVGYIQGSGDKVPETLRQAGYTVEIIDEETIAGGDLKRFDALVAGIRAYNTKPRLLALHPQLMAYVKGGGRLIVQYNTNNRFNPLKAEIGPEPFEITRDRVTDETAELVAIDPKHPLLTSPNVLGPADFAGWVQERGLYFAGKWGPGYQAIFRANDPGEAPLEGGLIVAKHGKGVFVYTGLALWRQLPAGVPGALRLFANLLANPKK